MYLIIQKLTDSGEILISLGFTFKQGKVWQALFPHK
jgi:hypothetical protein